MYDYDTKNQMKIRIHTKLILVVLALISCSCNKSKIDADKVEISNEKALSQIVENYRSIDGNGYLLLMSSGECELSDGSNSFIGSYSKQDNTIRIVMPVMGTSQVSYYEYCEEGIRDTHGRILKNIDEVCISYARRIGIACFEYLEANHGSHPPSLDLLIPNYLPSRKLLAHPGSPHSDEIAYDYYPGTLLGSSYRVLLRSKYKNSANQQLVVRYDSDVSFKDPKEVEMMLKHQK